MPLPAGKQAMYESLAQNAIEEFQKEFSIEEQGKFADWFAKWSNAATYTYLGRALYAYHKAHNNVQHAHVVLDGVQPE